MLIVNSDDPEHDQEMNISEPLQMCYAFIMNILDIVGKSIDSHAKTLQ